MLLETMDGGQHGLRGKRKRDWRPARGGEAGTSLARRAGHHSLSPKPGTRLELDLTEHAWRMREPRQGGLTTTSIRPLGPESCGRRMMRGCRPAGGTGKQTGGSRAKAARKKVGAGHGEDEYDDLGRKKKREELEKGGFTPFGSVCEASILKQIQR
jgi:hypothetical protein